MYGSFTNFTVASLLAYSLWSGDSFNCRAASRALMESHIGGCAERKVALECAPDGFPGRINLHSTRTLTQMRFRSPSEVLAKFWQNSGKPYERADKAVLW